jgi:hypothetical protein
MKTMQPAQLQRIKEVLLRFEALQEKYKEFGADDRGTLLELHRGIRSIVTTNTSIYPLTAADWKLFKSMPDSPKVAAALNETATELMALLRTIDWSSPLAPVIKNFLAEYCGTPDLFGEIESLPPLKHSINSYAGAKWILPGNQEYDPKRSWEENYKILEKQHDRETTYLIGKVRELAANLPGNVLLSTKSIHLIQMPDGKYVQDWNASPTQFEVFTVSDPFEAVHFPEANVQQVFELYFAPRAGKIVPVTMCLKLTNIEAASRPLSFVERSADKVVRSLRRTSFMKAVARAVLKHVE